MKSKHKSAQQLVLQVLGEFRDYLSNVDRRRGTHANRKSIKKIDKAMQVTGTHFLPKEELDTAKGIALQAAALEKFARAIGLELSTDFGVGDFAALLQAGCEILSPDDDRTAAIAEALALKFAFIAEEDTTAK